MAANELTPEQIEAIERQIPSMREQIAAITDVEWVHAAYPMHLARKHLIQAWQHLGWALENIGDATQEDRPVPLRSDG